MQNKIKIIIWLLVFICGCSHQSKSAESWIDYNGLSKISVGLSQKDIENTLGEPLLILGDNDDDENIIYLFYNYHVKRYLPKSKERVSDGERNTLIKFTFANDELITWEEDNLTLNMSHQSKTGSTIKYVNLLINFILLVAVFGGS